MMREGRKESSMPMEATDTRDCIGDPVLLPRWLILGSVTLPGCAEYVREARKFVARTVGADHPQADTALLLTSELVTNAVTHSRSRLPGGTVDVVVAARASGLVVTVTDNGSDSAVPVIRNNPGSGNGNGLLLVESLADDWGYRRSPGRTMVWFRLSSNFPPPSAMLHSSVSRSTLAPDGLA
jgi:anti-sigma regulatory factor (Ser/Thr protein kinase)